MSALLHFLRINYSSKKLLHTKLEKNYEDYFQTASVKHDSIIL